MSSAPAAAPQEIPYARCPACERVTPRAWEVRPPATRHLVVPVTICCGGCGHVHIVTDQTELHTELDAEARHTTCGTTVPCPSIADIVRCPSPAHAGNPTIPGHPGRGRYFPGPATRTTP
jgi:hypothetical protein